MMANSRFCRIKQYAFWIILKMFLVIFKSVSKASRWLNRSTLSSKWRRSAMYFASLLILFIAAVFVFFCMIL